MAFIAELHVVVECCMSSFRGRAVELYDTRLAELSFIIVLELFWLLTAVTPARCVSISPHAYAFDIVSRAFFVDGHVDWNDASLRW